MSVFASNGSEGINPYIHRQTGSEVRGQLSSFDVKNEVKKSLSCFIYVIVGGDIQVQRWRLVPEM